MRLVLGFVPFIVFALLVRLSVDLALWLAFATGFTIGIQGFLHTRILKLLDVSSTALFGLLAIFRGFIEPGMPTTSVRLVIDASFLAVVLVSLVARQPLTIQYAREDAPRDLWDAPSFVRANYVMTLVWACAFAVMTGVDGAATFSPDVPLTGAVAAGLVTLAAALTFTWRYPVHARRNTRDKAPGLPSNRLPG